MKVGLAKKVFNMNTSDQSFSNVVALIMLGAVFATGATFVQDMRHRNSAPATASASTQQTAQQQGSATY